MARWRAPTFGFCLASVLGVSCSVFPDHAVLPGNSDSAGEASSGGATAGGSGTKPAEGGTPGGAADGESGNAGQPVGTAGTGATTSGGTGATTSGGTGGDTSGGTGGSAAGGAVNGGDGSGGATCNHRQMVRTPTEADTWIGSAKQGRNHGDETTLSVTAGDDEHRALLAITLPEAMTSAALRRATLRLRLVSNADARLTARTLSLHRLLRPLDEAQASWTNYGKGNEKWAPPGGEFGPELATASISEGSTSGNVDFDVTASLGQMLGEAVIPLSLIIIETSNPPPAPSELAFGSVEGNASLISELRLEYCDP